MVAKLKRKPNIIADLDGTLALEHHRRPQIASPGGWRSYFRGISQDPVNVSVHTLLHFMQTTHKIHIFTSRPEEYRQETEIWLLDNAIPFDVLDMRQAKDTNLDDGEWTKHRSDEDLKDEMLARYKLTPDNVAVVLEDRDAMVNFYRERGFDCWQVHPEGEMFIPSKDWGA